MKGDPQHRRKNLLKFAPKPNPRFLTLVWTGEDETYKEGAEADIALALELVPTGDGGSARLLAAASAARVAVRLLPRDGPLSGFVTLGMTSATSGRPRFVPFDEGDRSLIAALLAEVAPDPERGFPLFRLIRAAREKGYGVLFRSDLPLID